MQSRGNPGYLEGDMFNPMYKKSRLLFGNPESRVAIVSLWTKPQKIAEKVSQDKYCLIGQLFSAERGLDFMFRNLMANPQITNLVITGTDFSKSGVVLKDFFDKGFEKGITEATGKPVWRVKSEHPGYIGIDIPKEALEELRESIQIDWMEDISRLNPADLKVPFKRMEARTFEKPEETTTEYVGEDEVYVVRHEKVAGVWLQILDTILKFGKRSGTHYDDEQKEIIDLVSVITGEDPDNFDIPEFMPCDAKKVREYIPRVTTNFIEDGTTYTYGSRIRSWFGIDQFQETVRKLAREPISRSAVICLWDSRQDTIKGGSPCINHLWFRIRENRLYLTVTIRSNDMFEAYPENAYGMRALQEMMRKGVLQEMKTQGKEADIKLGDLVIVSQSAHIYDDCWERAREIVSKYYGKYIKHPSMQYDPRGNFSIEVTNGKIRLTHLSPGGDVIGKFEGRTAQELRDVLAREGVISTAVHGLYMGMELQKAEMANRLVLKYEQGMPLEGLVEKRMKPLGLPQTKEVRYGSEIPEKDRLKLQEKGLTESIFVFSRLGEEDKEKKKDDKPVSF